MGIYCGHANSDIYRPLRWAADVASKPRTWNRNAKAVSPKEHSTFRLTGLGRVPNPPGPFYLCWIDVVNVPNRHVPLIQYGKCFVMFSHLRSNAQRDCCHQRGRIKKTAGDGELSDVSDVSPMSLSPCRLLVFRSWRIACTFQTLCVRRLSPCYCITLARSYC